jgi:hypothetical protein
VVSIALLVGVGLCGVSAAEPPIGARSVLPPYDFALHAPSWLITALLVGAYLVGALVVWSGLDGRHAAALTGRRIACGVGSVAVLALLVPPFGSADHLSYLAYGRIAAAGQDAYLVDPGTWRVGLDAVAGAIQPPWQHTPSVYGPVATAAQAGVAWAGGGRLRLTVWLWQLLTAAAWCLAAWCLDRLTRHDGDLRRRAAVLWSLNPVLIGGLLFGAHVDLLAVALAGLALVAIPARGDEGERAMGWAVAGGFAGAALATKVTYGVVGLALLWAWAIGRRQGKHLAALGLGALAVLIPGYLLAGPHVLDQTRAASHFVSLASPWKPILASVSALGGQPVIRVLLPILAAAAAAGVAWRWRAGLPQRPGLPERSGLSRPAVGSQPAGQIWLVLAAAWLATATYMLPWYDAIVWWPLALVPTARRWAGLWLLRLVVLAVAYVPGLVLGMSAGVQVVTLGFRQWVAPVLTLGLVVALVITGPQESADRVRL